MLYKQTKMTDLNYPWYYFNQIGEYSQFEDDDCIRIEIGY